MAAIAMSIGIAGAQAADPEMEVKGQVQGLSGTCPNLTFMIGDQDVATDPATRFDDGACTDVANGRWVEVDGVVRDDTLYARDVDLKDGTND